MLKSVLLPLTSNIDASKLLPVAVDVARRSNGTVTGLFIRPDARASVPYMGEGLTADMIQQICDTAEEESLAACKEAKETFIATLGMLGVDLVEDFNHDSTTALWRENMGLVSGQVGRYARVADLSVCLKPDSDNIDSQDIFSELLFRSGRPVLMLPPSWSKGQVGRHVLICWNGRVEGARAVATAMPLIRSAEKVTLLQVGEIEHNLPGLDELKAYMGQHGVQSEARQDERMANSIAQQIHTTAQGLDVDMLVIGAYSHARWKELILGGVTNWLSSESEIPVFMSH